ncbi:YihY/virulence factor BrkB family protein [Paraflavisolibacter sp. H34]|uniref:YihY/virulence factor BrkB family protein n=1 Tax=Huijunlia imazamoxiresistens TaxID=3127457 RepID=UPI003019E856
MLLQKLKGKVSVPTPVQSMIDRSIDRTKDTYIPGFHGFSLFEVWRAFIAQLRKTSLIERAAAISFNMVMAIPPTLLFIFTLIPHLPISGKFIEELYSVIRDVVPGKQNNAVIIEFLDDFLLHPRNELLSFGLLLALFFSSNAMMGVLRSFDKDYEGFEKWNGLKKRQTALMLTLISFVLFFLFLSLLIAQGVVLDWVGIRNKVLRLLIINIRWVFIVMLIFYIVSFIYRHGPSVTRKWHFFTPGSVFTTTLVMLATGLFSFWVNHFSNYNKLYGSISAIFIIMSLIFVNSLVVLMGFELNVTIAALLRKKEAEKQL